MVSMSHAVGRLVDRYAVENKISSSIRIGVMQSLAFEIALLLSILTVSIVFSLPTWRYSASSSLMVQGGELGLSVKGSHHRAVPCSGNK